MIIREYPKIDRSGYNTLIRRRRNAKALKLDKEIDKLKHWNDYIIFEGKKYGIDPYYNWKHRTNDCFGTILFHDGCSGGVSSVECTRCGVLE